ncbi:MAG: hypothetical protein ACKO2V_06145, partial [Snowella sp.]
MPVDYVIFIHGVKVRNREVYFRDAERLFNKIKSSITNSSREIKPVYLFWGDVSESSTNQLLESLQDSPVWQKMWFNNLRKEQLLPFIGDAALYLSKYISAEVVKGIANQALSQMAIFLEDLEMLSSEDRLHLVTHSWGTVIIFDILFASRWEDPTLDKDTMRRINNIRKGFFGSASGGSNYGIPM